MIRIGFRTGMRIGTISDLKVDTIARSLPDPQIPGWHRINVGPGAHPPVSTKFGVTGEILISDAEIKLLLNYIGSTQRLMRVAKAPGIHRDLVFLTRNGTPYFSSGARQGRALSMGIFRLRKLGAETKNSSVANFHFHQTRATFATELVKILLRVTNAETALGFVKDALLHKNESTTLKYIQFVERTEAVAACADAFTQDFLQIPLSAHQANDS
ncbi:tyrosine-type recombinase/integrase [Luteimonas sp. WGS1318]|uniref:tyrosine-type recombinase/integrase n=1 Tax=Luteimonas sp. WGS1318 TaxID=3366815 RepID=UPI00372D0C29